MNRTAFLLCCMLLWVFPQSADARQDVKVYISVDMEGIGGVVYSDQVSSTGRDYGRFRLLMTEEANAAVQGALDAGATEIVVNDSHGGKRNIVFDSLHPAADLISGSPKQHGMMEGLDETFDAAVFIGYHANMGTENAILDHIISSGKVANILINGTVMNEATMNAALAGYYEVPVVFIAGDKSFVEQTRGLIGDQIEAAVVKDAVGRHAARNVSVTKVREMIREGVRRGIEKRRSMPVYTMRQPVQVEIDFLNSGLADKPSWIPGVKRLSGRTISYTGQDYEQVYKLVRALISLAGN